MVFHKTKLVPLLSPERLGPYLLAASGDLNQALVLYEHNQILSEALYVPLQNLEVGLRNRVFHHEPIFRMAQLSDVHRDIVLILTLLSPDLGAWNQENDRFPALMKMA